MWPLLCRAVSKQCGVAAVSPHVMESEFWNPVNFCLWNRKSWVLESGIQLKESGIPLTIGIQNASSTDRDKNPDPGIRNPQPGIRIPGLSWIPLKGNAVSVSGFTGFVWEELADWWKNRMRFKIYPNSCGHSLKL